MYHPLFRQLLKAVLLIGASGFLLAVLVLTQVSPAQPYYVTIVQQRHYTAQPMPNIKEATVNDINSRTNTK